MTSLDSTPLLHLQHAGWQLVLAPEIGGRIFALRAPIGGQARDVLVPVSLAAPRQRALGSAGSYPLVPFSNRIANAQFDAQGCPITLFAHPLGGPHAIHGLGWTGVWTVASQDTASATLAFQHPAAEWPWPFLAHQHFVLDENGLSVTLAIQNLGDTPMPCGLGFHPYFPRPAGTRLVTRTQSHWLCSPDRIPYGEEPTTGGPLDFSAGRILPTGLDDGFSGWAGDAELEYADYRLRIEGRGGLDHLVVYAPDAYDFCCVEPVSHVTNAANLPPAAQDRAGWRYVAPQARWQVSMRLSLS